jgi:hypothetical protein
MAALLASYLDQVAQQRSRFDCLLFAADWVRMATGVDPARSWRGSDGGKVRWLAERGGMRRVAIEAMRDFERVAVGRPGDVALVRAVQLKPARVIVAAICVHPDQWAVKSSDFALTIAGPPAIKPLAIWRVLPDA